MKMELLSDMRPAPSYAIIKNIRFNALLPCC